MLTCQHIACRIVDSCVRNYIPACQVLYLDRRFLYRNGNITFRPSPCMTSEELPLLRVWVHGRRDEEKQVEGMHQGNPLPDICTTSTRGSHAALHMIPDISRPHSPRLRRVNAGICTFSAFARKHCAARVCGTCALLEFDPIAGSMAGGGPEEGSAAAGGSAGDSAPATCRPASTRQEGNQCRGEGVFTARWPFFL